jgi:hypothetical protein
MDIGSYQMLLPPGVRIVGIQESFAGSAGYEPTVYCDANFFGEWENPFLTWHTIVFEKSRRLSTSRPMKDHSAARLLRELCKNLAYGTFNNVARLPIVRLILLPIPHRVDVHSRAPSIEVGVCTLWTACGRYGTADRLTQVQDFIDSGAGILLVSTDPVAMDIIELEAIEKKRRALGAPSLWHHDPNSIHRRQPCLLSRRATKNLFFRQPGHVAASRKLGPTDSPT